ncbi:MAG: sugar ABC transporter permease [Thermosphaera sp.]
MLPAVLALAAIVIFPSLYLLWLSLQHWIVFQPRSYFNGLGNYLAVLQSGAFWDSVRVTALYLVLSSALSLVLGLGLALALTKEMVLRGVSRALITLPLLIPPVVAGFAWKFLLNREIGVIGGFLLPSLGIQESMLGNPTLALISIVIADTWSKTAFMFLILLAALQSIPPTYYEAARIDGASGFQEFVHITMPMIIPAIIIGLIFRAIDAINTFDLIYVMTQGGPGTATQTLSIFGWKTAFSFFDLGRGAAIAVIMMFTAVIATSLLTRRLHR